MTTRKCQACRVVLYVSSFWNTYT